MGDIYILGIGNNTINVLELAIDCGYKIRGLLHYDNSRKGEVYLGYPILGSFEDHISFQFVMGTNFALSMGDLNIKKRLFERISFLGGLFPNLIHPTSYISRWATLGDGVQILPHSIIEGNSFVGNNTSITVNSVIAHNVDIGPHNLISSNCIIGAYCKIGELTHIGQGSVVVSGKVSSIGNNCILGAGSVLLCNMPSNQIFAGNPAHYIKDNL